MGSVRVTHCLDGMHNQGGKIKHSSSLAHERTDVAQGTTGPKILQRPPSRGQQRGDGNVLNAAQLQGLHSDARKMSTTREGCPQQPFRQLGASGLASEDL